MPTPRTLAVRTADPLPHRGRCWPARGAARCGRVLLARRQGINRRNSRRQGAGSTRHRWCRRQSTENLSERRDGHAASGRVQRPAADWLHAIDRDHQHQGRRAIGHLAAGIRLATMYTAAVATQASAASHAQRLIALLTSPRAAPQSGLRLLKRDGVRLNRFGIPKSVCF